MGSIFNVRSNAFQSKLFRASKTKLLWKLLPTTVLCANISVSLKLLKVGNVAFYDFAKGWLERLKLNKNVSITFKVDFTRKTQTLLQICPKFIANYEFR